MVELTTPDGPVLVNPTYVTRIEHYDDDWSRIHFADADDPVLVSGNVTQVQTLLGL